MIEIGIVSEVRDDRVRVAIGSLVTDFLPVLQLANSFMQSWSPLRVGEQAVVLPIRGELNSGVVLRGAYYTAHPAPTTNDKQELTVYEDGTTISYDTGAKELKIDATDKITVVSSGDISVSCTNATVTADSVTVDSGSIDLGTGGAGVVTGACMCALTGLAHHDFSSNTRSAK